MIRLAPPSSRCSEHPAYEADYCPICGTAQTITTTTEDRMIHDTKAAQERTSRMIRRLAEVERDKQLDRVSAAREAVTRCWCGAVANYREPVDPMVTNPTTTMGDGEPGVDVCAEHISRDGYEAAPSPVRSQQTTDPLGLGLTYPVMFLAVDRETGREVPLTGLMYEDDPNLVTACLVAEDVAEHTTADLVAVMEVWA